MNLRPPAPGRSAGHGPLRGLRLPRDESGFTVVEVLAAILLLGIGLLGALQLLATAVGTTAGNHVRQQGTNLARQATESVRTLNYGQLTSSLLAAHVGPLMPGASVNGSTITITRDGMTYSLDFSSCSMDDPSDSAGSHSSAPSSGGAWCSNVGSSGSGDGDPDDYKRVTVTVTPPAKYAAQTVKQTTLIKSTGPVAPVVDCISTDSTCPGTDRTYGSSIGSITFNVTTQSTVSQIRWQVNGVQPTAAQLGSANDPYTPSGATSQFTWILSGVPDGTYQISAVAIDANGFTGNAKTIQITLNRADAAPPATFMAGWNDRPNAVDTFWIPSADQDVLYYRVFRQYGTNSPQQVCQTDTASITNLITENSCYYDPTTPDRAGPPGCQNPPQSYTTSDVYWVVGVDTDPTTGLPRQSTQISPTRDANLCNKMPKTPGGFNAVLSGGKVTLTWDMPGTPYDPDTGDTIDGWRIYRWSSALGGIQYPDYRWDFVDARDSGGNYVTTFVDEAPDPGGQTQKYCVTAVDTRLGESGCSATKTA